MSRVRLRRPSLDAFKFGAVATCIAVDGSGSRSLHHRQTMVVIYVPSIYVFQAARIQEKTSLFFSSCSCIT